MKVPTPIAKDYYGCTYALFEARGKNLSITAMFGSSGVEQDAFQAKRIQAPAHYRDGKAPDGLIIREALGEYVHFEDTPIGSPEPGLSMMARNLFEGRRETRYIFETLDEAEGAAHAIMRAAGKDIPLTHEFLPGETGVPALLKHGDLMFGFVRDVTNSKLAIRDYVVRETVYMSGRQFHDLWIATSPLKGRGPSLMESFRSVDGGAHWRRTFNDAEVAGYFTRAQAERGARAYAMRIQKNLGRFLPG